MSSLPRATTAPTRGVTPFAPAAGDDLRTEYERMSTDVEVLKTYTDASGRRYAVIKVAVHDRDERRIFEGNRTVHVLLRPNMRKNDRQLNHARD